MRKASRHRLKTYLKVSAVKRSLIFVLAVTILTALFSSKDATITAMSLLIHKNDFPCNCGRKLYWLG